MLCHMIFLCLLFKGTSILSPIMAVPRNFRMIWIMKVKKPNSAFCYNESESESEVTQSCPTLCDPVDCSPPGSSVHGSLQARILEWVAIPFSRGIFLTLGLNLDLLHCRQILLPSEPPGKPVTLYAFSIAAVRNFYKLSCLKQHKFMTLPF